jgi:hypothetical protein
MGEDRHLYGSGVHGGKFDNRRTPAPRSAADAPAAHGEQTGSLAPAQRPRALEPDRPGQAVRDAYGIDATVEAGHVPAHLTAGRCCELDTDGDGDCPRHPRAGALGIVAEPPADDAPQAETNAWDAAVVDAAVDAAVDGAHATRGMDLAAPGAERSGVRVVTLQGDDVDLVYDALAVYFVALRKKRPTGRVATLKVEKINARSLRIKGDGDRELGLLREVKPDADLPDIVRATKLALQLRLIP